MTRPTLRAGAVPPPPVRPMLLVAAVLLAAAASVAPFEHSWSGRAMRATTHALQPIAPYVDLGAAFGATAGIVLVVVLVVALDSRWRATLPPIFPGVLILGLLNGGLKLLFRRQRPMWDAGRDFILSVPPEQAGHWFVTPYPTWRNLFDERYLSFPSGHSAAAAYLAAALSDAYPRGRWVWWTLAILCMVSRFEGTRHYLGDCLAGAGVGLVVFALSRRWAITAPVTRWLTRLLPPRATPTPAPTPSASASASA